MKYWRTMLIALALGACGLVVWANDATKNKDTKPVGETLPAVPLIPMPPPSISVPDKDDSLNVPIPGKAPESEKPVVLDLAAANPAPPIPPPLDIKLPVAGPVVPPMVPTVDSPKELASLPSDPPPLPRSVRLDTPPPPLPPSEPKLPDPPKVIVPVVDLPRPVETPKVKPFEPSAPPVPAPSVEVPPPLPSSPKLETTPPMELKSKNPAFVEQPSTPRVPAKPASGAYKLHVRMGGNLGPRFEVRDGDALLLKVYCDRIDLHGSQDGSTAVPGLTASGKVRVSGSGLSGTCEQLVLASVKGEVLLKGSVRMTCYRGNASTKVVAEQMSFQLTGNADVPVKTANAVMPASLK